MADKLQDLPDVTEAHRQTAFVRLRFPDGITFEQAMGDRIRRKLIEACAAHIRTAEFKRRNQPVYQSAARFNPITGQWRTSVIRSGYAANTQRQIDLAA